MLGWFYRSGVIAVILAVALVGGVLVQLYDLFRHPSLRRAAVGAGVVLLALVVVVGIYTLLFFQRDVPEVHANIADHFRYGSIGGELFPYWIWLVLPDVFPEYLPDRPGEGYARMGFISEPDSPTGRPVGVSFRERPIPSVGLNCAACHAGVVRESPEAPALIVLGMPGNKFDLQGYLDFWFDAAKDERFNADTLLPAIRDRNPDFSFFDGLMYRFVVIPRVRDRLRETAEDFSWTKRFPQAGPGRTDTFNPYKSIYGVGDPTETVGTSDLPSLWNQRIRDGMNLHWDGNNSSLAERNINASIGASGIRDAPNLLDFEGITRVADWIANLGPPDFPAARIDRSRVAAGEGVYRRHCAACHALDGALIGQVTPVDQVGSDPNRLHSFTEQLAARLNKTGEGRPWAYSHFRKTDGYANMLLDGIWLRAPYLHNGSVPTLRDLLKPVAERPSVFYRGYDVYDYESVGFVSSGPEAERLGFRYDTTEPGNGNQGHTYGTDLSPRQIEDLLEYLKTN